MASGSRGPPQPSLGTAAVASQLPITTRRVEEEAHHPELRTDPAPLGLLTITETRAHRPIWLRTITEIRTSAAAPQSAEGGRSCGSALTKACKMLRIRGRR